MVRLGLSAVAAAYLAMLFELERPEWAAWTVLSVSLTTRASSLQKASWRALGTLLGACVSLLLVSAFAQDTLAFDIALALWLCLATVGASLVRGQSSYGFSLTGFTVPIITLSNVSAPMSVFSTAVDRCSALLLGIACAEASAAFVAPGVPAVQASLSDKMNAAVSACAAWLRSGRAGNGWGDPPIKAVLSLDGAIADAFVEQPSLQTGGRAAARVPGALLAVLATGLLEARLPPGGRGIPADRLLGWSVSGAEWRLRRAQAVGRVLRRGGRIGRRRAPSQSHAPDRDGRVALNNGLRTAAAVSLVNAFWYVSEWSSGGAAVTYAGLVSALLASRDNPPRAALDFLIGAALAYFVGIMAHYTILTTSGAFGLLAAVMLPVGMMAAMGRQDSRAVISGGYGITVFAALEPLNVMPYDLAASLNGAIAALSGVAVAILAFSALPPPATLATRRAWAQRRMVRAVLAAAQRPAFLLPRPEQWCAPMFERLALIAPEGAEAVAGGQSLLLIGLLVLAARAGGAAEGRLAGRALLEEIKGRDGALARAAASFRPGSLQAARLEAVAVLLRGVPPGFPGLPRPA